MVAPVLAKLVASSFAGMGVLPWVRVRTTLWLAPGAVSSVPSAAAAAKTELMPGTMLTGMSIFARASICSLTAP